MIRLVPVYLAGDPQPAFLFDLREHRGGLNDAIAIDQFIGLFSQRYSIAGSSIWVRSNLFTPAAPAGTYIGLRITGGTLTFTPPPTIVGQKLTIPANGKCIVRLELAAPDAVASAGGEAGGDAANAVADLPSECSFVLASGRATMTKVTRAAWTLYDQRLEFDWHRGSTPFFEPLLHAVVIPMTVSERDVAIGETASPFAVIAGTAAVRRGGWLLPAATIDVTHPTEASGIGALGVQTAEGLTLTWRGLREGPVDLPSPWVTLAPGLILIIDAAASARYARQTFRLWKDADSHFRSELALAFTDKFRAIYASAAAGTEVAIAETDVEARIDRPVDVKGTPLSVRTLRSLLVLAYTDQAQHVSVYDDNILVDALDPHVRWPVERGRPLSLAIRNALFTITPVNSLLLFAKLRDEEIVENGTLMLGMGMYGLLPTLPDPYAANVGLFRRRGRGELLSRQVSQLLVGSVTWTKAGEDEDPDAARTQFAFAPLGTQEETFRAWTSAAQQLRLAEAVALPNAAPPQDEAQVRASFFARQSDEAVWNHVFQRFGQEQFSLLDVSSNADQMGVSFAWFNARELSSDDFVFYRIYGPKGESKSQAAPFPLQVRDLDLSAESRYVRAFTVPQISWEPLINLPNPKVPLIAGDPPHWYNLYPSDGGPTRLLTDSVELVPIAPIPVTEFLVRDFDTRADGFTGALFTLPFGLRAFAEFSRRNQFIAALPAAKVAFNRPEYDEGLTGGLQLRVDAPKHPDDGGTFQGSTLQMDNVQLPDGTLTGAGTLGSSVGRIFNKEFFYDAPPADKKRGVPLERIDFSGYGASMFSHWQAPYAAIAETSQARFDVFVGRTALEVIQVRSLVYPLGIRVVRTITMFRMSSANVFRWDTGWQPESDGVYDFRWKAYDPFQVKVDQPNPYEFHPGLIRGAFNVRNIRETNDIPLFTAVWAKADGEKYLDELGALQPVGPSTPPAFRNKGIELQPVYFDADIEIEGVKSGGTNGRVPTKGMLGYVQLAPRGEPIAPRFLEQLLASQFGAIGGPVDCVIDVASSGQLMRISRADVNMSKDGVTPIFVSAARGSVVLPKDGSWSVVQHVQGSGEVIPLDPQVTVPLIRRGRLLDPKTGTTDSTADDRMRLANPIDLVQPPGPQTRNYGFLQSTGTQKALFRLPSFKPGVKELFGAPPDFADAYRIVKSASVFPHVQDAVPLVLGAFKTQILADGYRLIDEANPARVFEQELPRGPLFLINEKFLKIYIEYAKSPAAADRGRLRFGFDSSTPDVAKSWLSKLENIQMVVDLGPLTRLMTIKGRFDAEKGRAPAFVEPQLEFSKSLQPVIDILQILLQLQGGDYKAAFQKGLEIAMSNSADSWNYAFHARKEIPVVKFPPGALYDNPTNPFKLEAHLAIGAYFNEALKLTGDPNQLVPSSGAFFEFGGRLSVMCFSIAAATVYATGSVDLRTAADIKTGPSLKMRFGFGAEIIVGLPVVGNVSLLYMVGVEIDLDATQITVSGFLLFRGHAELLGGIVSITITIEAKGSVKRLTAGDGRTDIIAQVTFGIDISIFLVINISFSESWQESRQIA
ncbi:MAG: hypothetical protein AABO58_07560 [Acidobacteriota bacterium]